MVGIAKLVGVSIVCEMFYVVPMQFAGIAVLWLLCSRERQRIVSEHEPSSSKGNASLEKSALDGNEVARRGELKPGQSGMRHRSKHPRGMDETVTNSNKSKVKAHKKGWLLMMIVSILVGSASVSLDRFICRYQMANWLAVIWIFVACDLAFLFLFGYV